MPNHKRRSNPELEALRQQVLKQQRNTAAKIRRNIAKGVRIANTNADPRVNAAKIARYTAKQLQAHSERLAQFNGRTNQFVPGAEGLPIPRHKWEAYKRAEAAVNGLSDSLIGPVANVKLPGQDMTVGERQATFKDGRVKSNGDAVQSIYPKLNRKSTGIATLDALDKFINQAIKRQTKEYSIDSVKESRRQANRMFDEIGVDSNTRKQLDDLSDYQFFVLWEHTSFAEDASLKYFIYGQIAAGRKERQFASQLEDAESGIRKNLKWAAEKVPRERDA